jgi:anthranilate 1,2-dioxygenase small subunit
MSPGTGLALDRATLRERVEDLYTRYFDTVADGHIGDWPAYFTEDAVYRVWPEQGLEDGLPMPLMYVAGMDLFTLRVTCIKETMFAQQAKFSYDWRLKQVTDDPGGARITATGKFDVTRKLKGQPASKVWFGRFTDTIVRGAGPALLFSNREIVYLNTEITASPVRPL